MRISTERKQYNSVDLFKFIFAIVVVMIHTKPFNDISSKLTTFFNATVGNMAVPFFFVASGFLFFDKCNSLNNHESKAYLKKYIVRLLWMYLIWCVIWLPWKLLHFYNMNFSAVEIAYYLRDVVFYGGGDALWYLTALMVAISVVYFLTVRIKQPGMVVAITALFYAMGVVLGSWYGLIKNWWIVKAYYTVFGNTDNGILCGAIYVSVGMLIAKTPPKKINFVQLICFPVFFALMCAEAYIVHQADLMYNNDVNLLLMPVVAYVLFRIIICIPTKPGTTWAVLRETSTLVYLCHCLIIRFLKLVLTILDRNLKSYIFFGMVLILSVVFATFVRYLVNKRKVKCLRKVY